MIKFFDFAYYYIYQLNRKGYKWNNHDYARGYLAMMLSICSAISTFSFGVFVDMYLHIDSLVVLFALPILTYTGVYYFAGKLYSKGHPREYIITEYDNKYSFKEQNRYAQVVLLWVCVIGWWILCITVNLIAKKYLGI